MDAKDTSPQPERRGFIKKLSAVVIGALVGIVPGFAGLLVWLDPLRRKSEKGGPVLVTALAAVPEDGTPRKFPVISSHTDAWNRMPRVPVGAVYLRRLGGSRIQAFNVACPHAGCFVDYLTSRNSYFCPCHNSTFALDGTVNDPKSPSLRGLDELEAEIRNSTEVWVKFQNYRAGEKEKIPA
jgi:menaquinol-cytochrome c reductase iron-sulfur subunit